MGGLVGYKYGGGITDSYWDKWTSESAISAGGEGKTTQQLQSPTAAAGIYSRWSAETWDFGTSEQYPALKYSDGTVMPNQPIGRPDLSHKLSVEITGVPTDAIAEGETITLGVYAQYSAISVPLTYRWTQISGEALSIDSTTHTLTLRVPEDYVSADAATGNAVLALEVSNYFGSTTRQVAITIAKRDNGQISTSDAPSLNGRELEASTIDLNGDPDGGVSRISYQWQSRESTRTAWVNVSAGTTKTQVIPENFRGVVQYRVIVSYTDSQGYSGEIITEAVIYEREYSLTEIASLTSCGTTDIDQDDDGLIEICDLDGLNAIRHQLDGTGYKADQSALVITRGCRPSGGCRGYELTKDLDFNDANSYSSMANQVVWTTGAGWEPIGLYAGSDNDSNNPFTATFDGNDYTISNLMINGSQLNSAGLFGYVRRQSKIFNIGLLNMNVVGNRFVGGLVAYNAGNVTNSYTTGSVTGTMNVGGLVGYNSGSVTTSYARGSATGSVNIGGLVGHNFSESITNSYATGSVAGTDSQAKVGGLIGDNYSGSITNSYATGSVTGTGSQAEVGGLIGNNYSGSIINSYWDVWTSGEMASAGGIGKTTLQLQSPTATIGIYRNWSTEVWDFGTIEQYPALRYSDGTVMPNQPIERPDLSQKLSVEVIGVPTGAVNEGEHITLTASSSDSEISVPLNYRWTQISGEALLIESTTQTLTLRVPENYVPANADTVDLAIMVSAMSDVGSAAQQVVITIAKKDNGQITTLDLPTLNKRELTAPAIDLSGDPDGGVSSIGYQWQTRVDTQTAWVDVPTGTSGAYTIPENVVGVVQYRVIVSYTDGQGYNKELVSQSVVYERRVLPIKIVISALCDPMDIDQDGDGLIEICDLEGLSAMRYQIDGTGYKASRSSARVTTGCPATGCKGYELLRNLDFNVSSSYRNVANKTTWTTGTGWEPIGTEDSPFNAIFNANKYSISNLMINRPSANNVGLFGELGRSASIENVGLINVNVTGSWGIGSLAGQNNGGSVISNSYATGTIQGGNSAGGLVGDNFSRIINSYTNISVSGSSYIGGIVGCNFSSGKVITSYTVPRITRGSSNMGGILGFNSSSRGGVLNSYWDRDISGISNGEYGMGRTTAQLQSPTVATGIYSGWSSEAWDFGTAEQYPTHQHRRGTPNQGGMSLGDASSIQLVIVTGVPANAVDESERITLTASSRNNENDIPLNYSWSEMSGRALLIEPTTRNSVTIEVPEDYIETGANSGNLVLTLEADNFVASTAQQIVIAVTKLNNGQIEILGAPSLNERELTAPAIDLSGDPDGGVNSIRYQWQSREDAQSAWANVLAGTSEVYTIPEDVFGTFEYRVVVSYTDGQGYNEQVISEVVVYERIDPLISEVNSVSCNLTDIDQDDDGLIEICDLEGLNAIRYQLDGTGYKASGSAIKVTTGCPATGCKGYELMKDLNFNENNSYSSTANKVIWTTGSGLETNWEFFYSEL